MKNYVDDRINDLQTLAFTTIPALIRNGCTIDEYMNGGRIPLNTTLMEAVLGAEFKVPKSGQQVKMKMCHSLPTKQQIAKICDILNLYVLTVENPFLKANHIEIDNDMDIPIQVAMGNGAAIVEYNSKMSEKKLRELIFGEGGNSGPIGMTMLGVSDALNLSAMAEDIRRKQIILTVSIIAGVLILGTAAAITVGCMCNKKSSNDDVDIIDDDYCDLSDDTDDIIDVDDIDNIVDSSDMHALLKANIIR